MKRRSRSPASDYWDDTLWFVLFFAFVFAVGCVRSVTVCTGYDRTLGRDPSGWQRDGMSASVCAEVVPPGASQ